MQRYFVELAYLGTNYHGWQIQDNAKSVQEILNNSFSNVLSEKIELVGAGRTDAGVHASFYVAHFDSENLDISCEILKNKMNKYLPFDISISKIYKVDNEMHSRFSAKSRTYKYFICQTKNPFKSNLSYCFSLSLNIDEMNNSCKHLLGEQDFSCFSRSNSGVNNNICKITNAIWEKDEDMLIFTISANRFLRNMVRAIVGTMIEIGLNKKSAVNIKDIIMSKNRSNAGTSAPAHGLFLSDILYH